MASCRARCTEPRRRRRRPGLCAPGALVERLVVDLADVGHQPDLNPGRRGGRGFNGRRCGRHGRGRARRSHRLRRRRRSTVDTKGASFISPPKKKRQPEGVRPQASVHTTREVRFFGATASLTPNAFRLLLIRLAVGGSARPRADQAGDHDDGRNVRRSADFPTKSGRAGSRGAWPAELQNPNAGEGRAKRAKQRRPVAKDRAARPMKPLPAVMPSSNRPTAPSVKLAANAGHQPARITAM